MIRLFIPCLFVLLFICFAPAAPVPKHLFPKNRQVYFPTQVGTKWVWLFGEEERTEVITNVKDQGDGTKLVCVGRVQPNGTVLEDRRILVSDRGLRKLSQSGHTFNSPYDLLRVPFQKGETWKNVEEGLWERNCTVREIEWVDVPAGRFLAVRVEWDEFVTPDRLEKTVEWYAPDVGLVKMIPSQATENDFGVLKSFHSGTIHISDY